MSVKIPTVSILNNRFEYRNSAATDITLTWRKFGWIPKGEQNERQASRSTEKQRDLDSKAVRK